MITIALNGERVTVAEELEVDVIRQGPGTGGRIIVTAISPTVPPGSLTRTVVHTHTTEFDSFTDDSIAEATAPVHEWIHEHQEESEDAS